MLLMSVMCARRKLNVAMEWIQHITMACTELRQLFFDFNVNFNINFNFMGIKLVADKINIK